MAYFKAVPMVKRRDINEVPDEILAKILSSLSVKEKFQCERVCHRWQRVVFTTIQSLAFENFDDAFGRQHGHAVYQKDVLPLTVNANVGIMNIIITKCGPYLRAFRGFVEVPTLFVIVKYCKHLHCIDMLLHDLESLELISKTYGRQLTCAVLYVNLRHGIKQFVSNCTSLRSLAILSPPYASYERTTTPVNVLASSIQDDELPKSLQMVNNLVLNKECVTEETLEMLLLFTDLKSVHISLPHYLNRTSLWSLVMKSWVNLRSLTLDVTSENCIHYDPLPPNLEYLSFKTLGYYRNCPTRNTIRFSETLPRLKKLHICLRSLPGNSLKAMLESIACFCPSVEEFSLIIVNMDEFDGDMDEQLEPLMGMIHLKLLNLGCQFKFSDNFLSKLSGELKLLGPTSNRPHHHPDNLSSASSVNCNRFRAIPCSQSSVANFGFLGEIKIRCLCLNRIH